MPYPYPYRPFPSINTSHICTSLPYPSIFQVAFLSFYDPWFHSHFFLTFMISVSAGLELLEGYQALHRQLALERTLATQETNKRDSLKKLLDCLGTWRKKLIAQLPVIYPITQVGLSYFLLPLLIFLFHILLFFLLFRHLLLQVFFSLNIVVS